MFFFSLVVTAQEYWLMLFPACAAVTAVTQACMLASLCYSL